jgi:hypothetical protein
MNLGTKTADTLVCRVITVGILNAVVAHSKVPGSLHYIQEKDRESYLVLYVSCIPHFSSVPSLGNSMPSHLITLEISAY